MNTATGIWMLTAIAMGFVDEDECRRLQDELQSAAARLTSETGIAVVVGCEELEITEEDVE
jgi:hypothetical protein